MNRVILTALIATTLGACATNPDKVGAKYVSSTEFAGYSCEQIREEYRRSTSDLDTLNATMKSLHRKNTAAVTIGAVLFWPALFFAKSKNQTNDEALAELKGRHAALEVEANKCDALDNMTGVTP